MADLEKTSYVAAVVSLPFTIIQTLMTVFGYLPALVVGTKSAPTLSSVARLPELGLEGVLPSPATDAAAASTESLGFLSLITAFPVQTVPAISNNVAATLVVVLLNVAMAFTVAGIVLWFVERKTSSLYVVTAAIFGGLAAFHAEFMIRKFVFGGDIASQPGDWMSEARGFFLLFWGIWLIYALVLHMKLLSFPFRGTDQHAEAQVKWTLREQRNSLPTPRTTRVHESREKAWVSFSADFFIIQVLLVWNADDLEGEGIFLLVSLCVIFAINMLCVKVSRWSRTGPHV